MVSKLKLFNAQHYVFFNFTFQYQCYQYWNNYVTTVIIYYKLYVKNVFHSPAVKTFNVNITIIVFEKNILHLNWNLYKINYFKCALPVCSYLTDNHKQGQISINLTHHFNNTTSNLVTRFILSVIFLLKLEILLFIFFRWELDKKIDTTFISAQL